MATRRPIFRTLLGGIDYFKQIPLTDTIPEENVPQLGNIAKLPNIPTGKMLARTTAGTGAVELVDIPTGVADALKFKGSLDCSANPNYPTAVLGDVYRVSVAGKVGGAAGINVEIGDMVTCIANTASGNHATVGANWVISQTNLDGAVIGQAASIDNEVALFSGTSGKIIKRAVSSGLALLTSGVLSVITTSAGLLAAISDAIGTGKLLFSEPPTRQITGTTGSIETSDSSSLIETTNSSAVTITVNAGNVVVFQKGTGQITFVAGSGVTLHAKNGLKSSGQKAFVSILKTHTANEFGVTGDTTT